jgi:microcystin-dependent protein
MLDWGGSADPAGGHFLLCDGRAISRTTYAALFAIIGVTYGVGDGSTTFNIPDLRGRTSVMVDGAAARMASNDALGNSSGEETHALTLAELAVHHHGLWFNTRFIPGNAGLGTFNPFEKDNTGASDISFDSGSGTAHNNMPPYLVVNKIIRVS